MQEIVKRILEQGNKAMLELKFSNPFELLISALLAPQTTDIQVNKSTERLFQKFKSPEDFSKLTVSQLKPYISNINFWRTKAENIIKVCKELVKRGGKLPEKIEDLLSLPGVGRKTANIVLGGAFGKPAIIVDTHVKRLSLRMGLVGKECQNADDIELELQKIVPQDKWFAFSVALIEFGKKICKAKNPLCSDCVVSKNCPSAFKV